jgi:glycosyltransferase involved in cell wall biosynthesis
MLVTIMIPTFNQEDYIKKSIESALNQTYKHIEIIVNDDFSTDNTFLIANSIKDKKLKVFRNSINLGRVANYRKILYEYASGNFVINLDADDYFTDNEYIKNAVDLITKNGLDMVFSNHIIKFKEYGIETKMDLPEIIDGNWLFFNYKKKNIHFPHMTVIYNKNKAKKLNFYSMNIISSDWESLLKFVINSKVGFIKKSTGNWTQIDNSESKVQDINKVLENFDMIESVFKYASNYFNIKKLIIWKYGMFVMMIKDLSINLFEKNSLRILKFAYKNTNFIFFIQLILNYRIIGKIIFSKINSYRKKISK